MSIAKADPQSNRLYLQLGALAEDDLADEVYEVAKEVRKLRPGFTCITRLLWQDHRLSEKEARFVRLIQEFISLKGVAKVVRVSDESLHAQFEKQSRESGGYRAHWVATEKEAEDFLAIWEKETADPA